MSIFSSMISLERDSKDEEEKKFYLDLLIVVNIVIIKDVTEYYACCK